MCSRSHGVYAETRGHWMGFEEGCGFPLYSKVGSRPSGGAAGSTCTREGVIHLAEIFISDGESLESALRRFKRKVQQEDIIKEIKKHSFYLKPGEKKRVKQALARKRSRKKASRSSE